MTVQVTRIESGLWVPSGFSFNRLRPQVRTVTLPNGERAKVTHEPTGLDGESSVTHIERNDGIDAVVKPRQIILRVRSK